MTEKINMRDVFEVARKAEEAIKKIAELLPSHPSRNEMRFKELFLDQGKGLEIIKELIKKNKVSEEDFKWKGQKKELVADLIFWYDSGLFHKNINQTKLEEISGDIFSLGCSPSLFDKQRRIVKKAGKERNKSVRPI